MTDTNLLGTVNLLTVLKESCFEIFVHTGSSEEYGDTPSPCREDQRESPISPYSFSKLSSTHFCQMAAKTFDLPITTVRLFPTYGPFQESAMFVPSAITSLLAEKTFKMSPGEQKREFNFVGDIVEAYLKVAVCSEAHGEVLNVGNGIPYTLKQVISIIKELIGGNLNIELGALPYRKGEGAECFCDNRKVKAVNGLVTTGVPGRRAAVDRRVVSNINRTGAITTWPKSSRWALLVQEEWHTGILRDIGR